MQATAYLYFTGQCADAFSFYKEVLGGTLTMMRHGEMAPESRMPGLDDDSIVHARLTVGDTLLMGSDGPVAYTQKPAGFSVSLTVDTSADAERIFAAMSAGGSVNMAIVETFWAHRFGMCVDKFGVPWMVNHEKPMG